MRAPATPPSLRGRVFRGRDAIAAGLLTRHQLVSRAWRPLFRGVYADATLPDTHGVAIAGAALIVPPSARRAVDLADERAESPQESRLRVMLLTSGLTPVPQYVVRDAEGRFVARVDLAFPEHRGAIEYDGAWHGKPGELTRDRRRHNAPVAAGWTVLHVTAVGMHDPAELVWSVRRLLAPRERGVVRRSLEVVTRISPRSQRAARPRDTARRS